jgi:hypothetical protein
MGKDTRHTKQGRGIVRIPYWQHLAQTADRLLRGMVAGAALLPSGSFALIKNLLPFGQYLFVFDDLFLDYIRRFITDRPEILRDLLSMLRCYYPQRDFPNPLYAMVSQYLTTKPTSPLDQFLTGLLAADVSPSQLDDAFQIAGKETAFTAHDLKMIWQIATDFLEYADRNKPAALATLVAQIAPPTSEDDEKYLIVPSWNCPGGKLKCDIQELRHLDDVVDAFDLVRLPALNFATSEELVDQLLRFSGQFLDINQRLSIETYPEIFHTNREEAVRAVQRNMESVRRFGAVLCGGLFWISDRRPKDDRRLESLAELHIERAVLPSLFEMFPADFAFGKADLLSRTAVLRFFAAFDARLGALGLLPDAQRLVRRAFFLEFVDRVDIALQTPANLINFSKIFTQFCQDKRDVIARLPRERMNLVMASATNLQQIAAGWKMRHCLQLIIRTMAVLQVYDETITTLVIAMSGNLDLVSVNKFLKAFLLTQRDVAKAILGEGDLKLLGLFTRAFKILQLAAYAPPGNM